MPCFYWKKYFLPFCFFWLLSFSSGFALSVKEALSSYENAIFYQIYLRSFQDSNGDGIGDLNGVKNQLDYLQALRVDYVWLSPIHPSPNHDWGYDVSDYVGIHPDFGTMSDFDELVAAAKEKGIKIIMDLVVNHTSTEHWWFKAAQSSQDNPYRDYYIWTKEPNNWYARFGLNKSAWTYNEEAKEYYLHTFLPQQADLNWQNPKVWKEIKSIMQFWLDKGVAGFRLDVCNYYAKKPSQSNPSKGLYYQLKHPEKSLFYRYDTQEHLYDRDRAENLAIINKMRQVVDEYDAVLIAEIDSEDHTKVSVQYSHPKNADFSTRTHFAYNMDLLHLPWSAQVFKNALQSWQNLLHEDAFGIISFDNHDNKRSFSRYGNDPDKANILAMLTFTLKGVPQNFNGGEIGMQEEAVPDEAKDSGAREVFSLNIAGKKIHLYPGRDGCRTPMLWTSQEQYYGFSTHKPWLKSKKSYKTSLGGVFEQYQSPTSLLSIFKELGRLRKENSALNASAQQIFLTETAKDVLGYFRISDTQKLLVLVNFSHHLKIHQLPEGQWKLIFGKGIAGQHFEKRIVLSGLEGMILEEIE